MSTRDSRKIVLNCAIIFLIFFLNRTWFLLLRAPSHTNCRWVGGGARHCTSMAGSGARETWIAILGTRHDFHPETTCCFTNSTHRHRALAVRLSLARHNGPLIPPLTRSSLVWGLYATREAKVRLRG